MTADPSSAQRLVGVVIVPEGLDHDVRVAGLDPVLRHCLALQSAGVESIRLLGAASLLPSDTRLKTEVSLGAPASAEPEDRYLVVVGDWTYHRALPARLAKRGLEQAPVLGVSGEGIAGPAVFLCEGSALAELATRLLAREVVSADCTAALPGEFVAPARTSREARAALKLHLRSLIKATGGIVDRHVARRFSLQITRVFLPTSVTPNMVTLLSLALALVSSVMVGFDDPRWYIGGAVLHFSVRIVDCVDGELARLRYQGSEFGAFLDTIADGIGLAALMTAVTFRVRGLDPIWLYLGVSGVVLYLVVQVLQLVLARRATGGGSLQAVEWAFLEKEATGVDRLVGIIHPLIRHDFISTLYVVLIAFNQLLPLLVIHAVASLIGAVYLASQLPQKLGARAS